MKLKEIKKFINKVYPKIEKHYGFSKFQECTPYVEIHHSPYSDSKDPHLVGEYCWDDNSLIVYWKNIKSKKQLIETLVHEYQHYLQSPSWMKRYYTMGYNYNDHPYEVAAYDEEKNWKKFV